jgi:hypothetical protein
LYNDDSTYFSWSNLTDQWNNAYNNNSSSNSDLSDFDVSNLRAAQDVSVDAVLTSLYLNAVIFVLLMIFYESLRRILPTVYSSRKRLRRTGQQKGSSATKQQQRRIPSNPTDASETTLPDSAPFDWVGPVFGVPWSQVRKTAGLDGYFFLRYIRMNVRITAVSTFWFALILVPLYITGNNPDTTGWYRISAANVYDVHGLRMWIPCIFLYLFSAFILFVVKQEYRHFLELRQDFLARGCEHVDPQHHYSLMIENIPSQLRSDTALQDYFAKLFPNKIHSASVVLKLPDLQEASRRCMRSCRRLEKSLAYYHATGIRPTHIVGRARFQLLGIDWNPLDCSTISNNNSSLIIIPNSSSSSVRTMPSIDEEEFMDHNHHTHPDDTTKIVDLHQPAHIITTTTTTTTTQTQLPRPKRGTRVDSIQYYTRELAAHSRVLFRLQQRKNSIAESGNASIRADNWWFEQVNSMANRILIDSVEENALISPYSDLVSNVATKSSSSAKATGAGGTTRIPTIVPPGVLGQEKSSSSTTTWRNTNHHHHHRSKKSSSSAAARGSSSSSRGSGGGGGGGGKYGSLWAVSNNNNNNNTSTTLDTKKEPLIDSHYDMQQYPPASAAVTSSITQLDTRIIQVDDQEDDNDDDDDEEEEDIVDDFDEDHLDDFSTTELLFATPFGSDQYTNCVRKFFGKLGLDFAVTIVRALTKQIEVGLEGVIGETMSSTGFVTFLDLASTTCAASAPLTVKAGALHVDIAPEPREIIWSNAHVSQTMQQRRERIANIILFLGAILWSFPLAAIQVFAKAENIAQIPGMEWILTWNGGNFSKFVNGYLPVIALLGLILILPVIFQYIAEKYERRKTISDVQASMLGRYFYYQLANIYVSVTAGSILKSITEILDHPSSLLISLGKSLPSMVGYFIALLVTKILAGLPMIFLRFGPLMRMLLLKILSDEKKLTQRELDAVYRLENVQYGWEFPTQLLVAVIVFTYSVICPIILPFGLLYFMGALMVYKKQILYVYSPVYEAGGAMFPHAVQLSLIGLVASQLTFLGYTLTRGCIYQPVFLFPLPLITISTSRYFQTTYVEPSKRLSLERAREYDRLSALREERKSPDSPVSATGSGAAASFDHGVEVRRKKFDKNNYRQPVLTELATEPWNYRRAMPEDPETEAVRRQLREINRYVTAVRESQRRRHLFDDVPPSPS